MGQADFTAEVDRFIREEIDTVPHLEALLLFWNTRPQQYSVAMMSERLFLAPEATKQILEDLARRKLIASNEEDGEPIYGYESELERDGLMAAVDMTYRRELIRISRLIHSKPSAAVREFARAFRIKKDRT